MVAIVVAIIFLDVFVPIWVHNTFFARKKAKFAKKKIVRVNATRTRTEYYW